MAAFTFAGLVAFGAGTALAFAVAGTFAGAVLFVTVFGAGALVCEAGLAGAAACLAGVVVCFTGAVLDGLVVAGIFVGVVCAVAATVRRAIVNKFFFSIFSCPLTSSPVPP